ncbi:hypothetical protein CYMTET_34653 [Cymbomonas tetramitiformis]|uniref:Uncharacterized protein n=1 Tax=Cymbomonas tetramitiformis TaxID=36881 RepID=A0AAE0KPZ7_9CHLO|nr:hypothetical protein CYMTET_34653 [Cymbomonas tetramitiformis]
MSTGPQRARMAAVRSALNSFRVHRRHSTIGYGVVVSGGVCAPDTKLESIAFTIDNECFDSFDLIPPLPSPSPYALPGHHLVVSGGAVTHTSPFTIVPFEPFPMRSTTSLHRIFHLRPPHPLPIDALALVVLHHFWPWHRTGVG